MTISESDKLWLKDFFIDNAYNLPILQQLARSVSKNLCDISSAEEALEYICTHISDTSALLNKRVITKEILFKYLTSKKVSIQVNFTKHTLINATLDLWAKNASNKSENNINNANVNKTNNFDLEETAASSSSNVLAASSVELNASVNESAYPINLLARQFSQWFFDKYNESSFKPTDFWPDATMQMQIFVHNDLQQINCNGVDTVIEQLMLSKQQLNSYHNPNLTHAGVQGRMDAHGRVLVLACGTLHTPQHCIGVFEYAFGMMRDPFGENNWKPKTLQCRLHHQLNADMPELMSCAALKEALMLQLPDGDLA